MKHAAGVIALAVLLTVGCAKDPKGLVFTEQNKEEVLKKVAESSSLSADDKQLVVAYFMRTEMAKGLGKAFGMDTSKAGNVFGKNVGQIIEEQKAWAAEQKAQEEKAKKLAAEAKAHEEARLAELKKSLLLTVFDMKKKEIGFTSATELKFVYENTSGKDIRAFEGELTMHDVLGEEVLKTWVKSTEILKAGAKRNESKLTTQEYKVRGKKLEDLKVAWKPTTVLFADGTRVDLEEKKADE